MKKYSIVFLCVLIGVFIYLQVPRPENISTPMQSSDPIISISIEKADEHGLEYRSVEEILRLFIRLGYNDIRINNFRLKYYHTGFQQVTHFESKESLTLKKQDVELINSTDRPTPNEQYDLKTFLEWCKQHTGQYADLQFGGRVKFNTIEKVSQICFENDVPYILKRASREKDNTDIRISLHQEGKEGGEGVIAPR